MTRTPSLRNKLISIGVDTGTVNGAIAIIDEDLKVLLLQKVPLLTTELKHRRNKSKLNKETMKFEKDYRKRNWVDFTKVGDLIRPHLSKSVIYTIEKVHARSLERETSSFLNGNTLGIFQGLYPFINPIEFYDPLPASWKGEFGLTSDKSGSVELAEDLFQISLRTYLPKGKMDDIAEALLLAFYGLKQHFDKKEE